MERKIGETFEYEGKKLQVKESHRYSCDGCFFNGHCEHSSNPIIGLCEKDQREDEKDVIFVEVQEQPQETEEPKERKIGEVFEYEGRKLKVVEAEIRCGNCFFHNGRCCTRINRTTGECKSSKRSDNESVVFVEVKDEQSQEQAEQPQELNLCEILKYCPDGETFWSPMLGDVKFYGIELNRKLVNVILENGEIWNINADGTITFGDVTSPEIMLYPSKEQRDWTKVKYEPKKERFDPKTLKPFDRVLAMNSSTWHCATFSHLRNTKSEFVYDCGGIYFRYCIPYNDDTKHLAGTNEEAPECYRYWED